MSDKGPNRNGVIQRSESPLATELWGLRWPDDPDAVDDHPTHHAAVAAAGTCGQLMRRTGGLWLPANPPNGAPVTVTHRATPAQRLTRTADLIDTLFAYLLYALMWTAVGAAVVWIPAAAFTAHTPSWAMNLISAALIVILGLGLTLAAALAARAAIATHQRIHDR